MRQPILRSRSPPVTPPISARAVAPRAAQPGLDATLLHGEGRYLRCMTDPLACGGSRVRDGAARAETGAGQPGQAGPYWAGGPSGWPRGAPRLGIAVSL
jgi:hypothetical protein